MSEKIRSGGAWRQYKWLITVLIAVIFCLMWINVGYANYTYIDADKSNWTDELKNAYKGARVYDTNQKKWVYDTNKIYIMQDDYISKDNHYMYVWDTVTDSMYYDINDKCNNSWIGTPEYDSSTNVFRIHYYIYSTGFCASTGVLIHPIFDTNSFWLNTYQYRTADKTLCKDLNINSWNQKNAAPDQQVRTTNFTTFNGQKIPATNASYY